MKLYKIAALIYYDMFVFKNSRWKIAEFIYFPLTTIIIWGLFSVFVRDKAVEAGLVVLVANIFWNFAYLAQSSVNMQMNDDTWSGSLKQILVTGITEFEYLTARMIFAIIISIGIMLLMLGISYYMFGLSLIATNASDILILSALTLFASLTLAILLAAMIIAAGREYSFLAWSALQAFILLSAPFYPVSIFPEPVQVVSKLMPFTNIFEATRSLVSAGTMNSAVLIEGFLITVAYAVFSLLAYKIVFHRARKTGGLVRLT